MLGDALIIGFALFLVHFITLETSFQRAKHAGRLIHFPVGIGLRLIFRLGGPLLIFAGAKMMQQASTSFDLTTATLVAMMGIGCLLCEPGTITATPEALMQKSILGLRKRTIPWVGATASYPRGLKEVLVVGSDGTTITHSQYHVAQGEFVDELKCHRVYLQS